MLECDRPDNEKGKEPLDKKIFVPWFKHCPKCGGMFILKEDGSKYICDKCGGAAFRITNNYYARYARWRREDYWGYHHGD